MSETQVHTVSDVKVYMDFNYLRRLENTIIATMLSSKENFKKISKELTSDFFTFSVHEKIFEYLLSYINEVKDFTVLNMKETRLEIACEIFYMYGIDTKTVLRVLDADQGESIEIDLIEIKDFNQHCRNSMSNNQDDDIIITIEDKFGEFTAVYRDGKILNLNSTYLFYLPKELSDSFQQTFENIAPYVEKENYEVLAEVDDVAHKISSFTLRKKIDQIEKVKSLLQWVEKHNLDRIDFSRNRAELINHIVINLPSLNLTSIPDELFEVKSNSIMVNLLDNHLEKIPSNVNLLKRCSFLIFCNNNIRVLPDGLFELDQLNSLCLHNNKITEIPKEISQLQSLESLTISNNDIEQLPSSISELKNLTSLDIENTLIDENSLELLNLEQLEKITFDDRLLPFFLKNMDRLMKIDMINLIHSEYTEEDDLIKGLQLNTGYDAWMEEKDYLGHGCVMLYMKDNEEVNIDLV